MSRFCIDCGKPMSPSAGRGMPAHSGPDPNAGVLPMANPDTPVPGAAVGSGALMPPTRVSPLAHANPCPKCAKSVDVSMAFCGHCGTRVTAVASIGECWTCGAAYTQGVDVFCARCGTRVGQRVSIDTNSYGGTLNLGAKNRAVGPKIALLNESGDIAAIFNLDRGEAVVGRGDVDIKFDDVFLSPTHARFELREGELWVRDLGSRNGPGTFSEAPAKLT